MTSDALQPVGEQSGSTGTGSFGSVSMTRMAAMSPTDAGTPEPTWLNWLSSHGPWTAVEFEVDRLVVLAAHPDDEVLGAGGMMADAARAGVEVVTVCLSDGSGSHPGSPTLTPEQLAVRRHAELDAATTILGLETPRWQGLPDGELAAHQQQMTGIVKSVLDEQPDAVTGLLSVWCHDGHPDHEAVGHCAQALAARRGIPLWMYPIWMWHWAYPGDPGIPWQQMRTHRLDDDVLAVKHAAVRSFESQIGPLSPAPEDQPVLGPHILSHLLREQEFVFV